MPGAVEMRYLVKGNVHEARSFDGTTIRYSSQGSGLTLITANGVSNTTTFWPCFEDYFSKIARVICWDYRGHGRSDIPEDLNTFKVECFAGDMLAVLNHARVDKAVLVGFSMGAQVILEFYRDNPDRVLALIPINGACGHPMEAYGTSERFKKLYTRVFQFVIDHPEVLERIGPPLILSPAA